MAPGRAAPARHRASRGFRPERHATQGTEAAKVRAELDSTTDEQDLSILLAAAEERARKARRAVAEHTRDHAVALAEALKPEAEAVVASLREHLEGVVRAVDAYFETERRSTAILGPVQGLDGQDLPSSDRIAQMQRWARRELGQPFPLPLPRSLVPQPNFPSLKVPAPGGDGWVKPQNVREDVAA